MLRLIEVLDISPVVKGHNSMSRRRSEQVFWNCTPALGGIIHGPPGPVPVGSGVENEWETDLEYSENEGNVNQDYVN